MKIDFAKLAASIVICQLAGALGAVFTVQSIPTWYAQLNKPAFSPPNWVFAPAWTTLYLLMGIALYIVWSKKGIDATSAKLALGVFGVQLALNAAWPIIFFGLRLPWLAFIEIIALWAFILATLVLFLKFPSPRGFCLRHTLRG